MTNEQALEIVKQPGRIGCQLIKANDEESNKYNQESIEALNTIIKALEQPTRKVGKWIKSEIGGAKVCSICQAHMGLSKFKFCPNCGADMRGTENG